MQIEPDPQGRWQNVIVYRATKTRKSKSADALRIPVLPDLQEAIDAMPASPHLTFLTDEGQPFKAKNLSKAFSTWAREASLPAGCTMHGLRKLVGRRLAEAGCSAMEIQAILGHADLRNSEIYVRAASKGKLAKAAMGRVIPVKKPDTESAVR